MGTSYGPGRFIDGTRIRWIALASFAVGGPLYAWYIGFIGFLSDIESAVLTSLGGIRTFLEGLFDSLFDSGVTAIESSWTSFGSEVNDWGLFGWLLTVFVTVLTLKLLFVGVRRLVQ